MVYAYLISFILMPFWAVVSLKKASNYLTDLTLGYYVLPLFDWALYLFLVEVAMKIIINSCRPCDWMQCAFLIWLSFTTLSCSSYAKNNQNLLPALICLDVMCFHDLIELYNFSDSICNKKHCHLLSTLCFDVMFFLNLIELYYFFLAVVALKNILISCRPCALIIMFFLCFLIHYKFISI